VGQIALMINRLSEFLKLTDIAVTVVLGNVENECTFNMLEYIKSKLCNCLDNQLNTYVKTFAKPFYTQETFPYQNTITH
jgi:hypothetical protein